MQKGRTKLYPDDFTNQRRLAFLRARAQAEYRGEGWTMTFEDFCALWPTESLWRNRGRLKTSLVMVRWDPEKSWSRSNCCIVTRWDQMRITGARRRGCDDREFYRQALWA